MLDYINMDKEKLLRLYEEEINKISKDNTSTKLTFKEGVSYMIDSCDNLKEICKNLQGIERGYRTLEERIALDKQRIKNAVFTSITDKDISTEIVNDNAVGDDNTCWEQVEVIYTINSYSYSDVSKVRDPVVLHAYYYADNLKLVNFDVVEYPDDISQLLLCNLFGLEKLIMKLDMDKENENS